MDQFGQHIHKDERQDVQKKTFTKWINSQLCKANKSAVTDLFYDLRDGVTLLALLEILTSKKIKREKGSMRVHHLNNVSKALRILEEENIKLVNISNDHIVDGSPKITLGLVWSIILHWQVQGLLKEVMADMQQTNLEKTLLAWCKQTTQGYVSVEVKNFTTSWTDGLAFNALIHRHKTHLFDWTVLCKKRPQARFENAFRLAKEHFQIERLLDPEDMNTQVPDKKSVMMYVMCLFQALPQCSFTVDEASMSLQSDVSFSMEEADGDKPRPLSLVSIGLGSYQSTLEEVLTWLLEAEDKLANMPDIAHNTKQVKDQFHELEEMMLELTAKQGSIGDVLSEGSRLLRENLMGDEEAEEVRVQMKLLNTRWEDLRVKAMDRQASLHDQLMRLQQEELETLRKWLTQTEDRIANMSQLGPTYEELTTQLTHHEKLQTDLESEQENINSLSNMVVVVDESGSDSAYSALEDELNALGERWAHICKWAEKRWATLQRLQVHWAELEMEWSRFKEWVEEKEKSLRQMESNPDASQQDMLQQAADIQVLKVEMDIKLKQYNCLHDKANTVLQDIPDDSSAHDKIPENLEMLQDRWDCLVSISEAQRQRLMASGIDFNKIVVTVEENSSGTTRVTTRTSTRSLHTEQDSQGSKRQKVSGTKKQEFSTAAQSLCDWMKGMESQINPTLTENLSLDQLRQLVQHIGVEAEQQESEYERTLSYGQAATLEASNSNESPVDDEAKMSLLKTRWNGLRKSIEHLRLRIDFLENLGRLQPQLTESRQAYTTVEHWINDAQSTADFQKNIVHEQLEECTKHKHIIEDNISKMANLEKQAKNLSFLFPMEKDAFSSNIQMLTFDWKNLAMRLTNREFILKEQVKQVTIPEIVIAEEILSKDEPMEVCEVTKTVTFEMNPDTDLSNPKLSEDLEELTQWLCKVEHSLESSPGLASIDKMEDWHLKFKEMLENVDRERIKLSSINKSLEESDSPLSSKVQELNEKWSRIVDRLTNRITDIEKGVQKQKQFDEETAGLKVWLAEVEVFLEAEVAAVGDIDTLKAQLEQSNALQDDIATLQTNVTTILETAHVFIAKGDPELKAAVETQLEELKSRWDFSLVKAKLQNKSLKSALQQSKEFQNGVADINTWLDGMEQKQPVSQTIETTSELNTAYASLDLLQTEIDQKSKLYLKVFKLATEMISGAEGSNDIEPVFKEMNTRWADIVGTLTTKKLAMSQCKDHYEKFKKLSGKERDWLDQLEAKLEKSTNSVADAEEISEALDDLDNHLRSHDAQCLEAINKLADELIKNSVMTVVVQNSTHSLSSRFDNLSAKAQEQQLRLEGGVKDAQELEREYVTTLERLSDIQMMLLQFPQQQQLNELEIELSTFHEILSRIRRQIEIYKAQGKVQAEARLQEQLDHLLKQFEEVEDKLRLSQQTFTYDTQLVAVSEQLSQIDQESRSAEVKSIEPNDIEDSLNQCMKLYRGLSDVKPEVEEVISTGRRIVKESMTTDPDTLTQQLDQLKALYNELGSSVTEQRGKLEVIVRQSKKAYKDVSQLDEWLDSVDKEILPESSDPDTERKQIQHALDDLARKKPLLVGLNESVEAMADLCGSELTANLKSRSNDIRTTYERVQSRLTERMGSIETKEQSMESFIVDIGDIKAWLESTETQLRNVEHLPQQDKESMLHHLNHELEIKRKCIDKTRDSAAKLVEHGTLYQSRLQPEFDSMLQRWQQIEKLIQREEGSVLSSSFDNLTRKEPLSDVELYFKEVSKKVDLIASLKEQGLRPRKHGVAVVVSQEFEQDVGRIEPDVATLISRGDTLTLTTHMVDVAKANSVRVAVNDLRRCWMNLKSLAETLKIEAHKVESEIAISESKATALLDWINNILKRLTQANNNVNELQAIQTEIEDKENEVTTLNNVGELLRRYEYTELNPSLSLINIRWEELYKQADQYTKLGSASTPQTQHKDLISVIPDFVANVNQIREAISAVCRKLKSKTLSQNIYDNLTSKEEELLRIKAELDRLKPKVDAVETQRLMTIKNATPTQTDQVRRTIDKLREEWAQVNRSYNDEHAKWVHCSDSRRALGRTIADFGTWLDLAEVKMKTSAKQPLGQAKISQKEIEKQITLKHRPSQTLVSLSQEMMQELCQSEANKIQAQVDRLLKRWKLLLADVASRRERLSKETDPVSSRPDTDYEQILSWIEQSQILMNKAINATDAESLGAHLKAVKEHSLLMDNINTKLKCLEESNFLGTHVHPMAETVSTIKELEQSVEKHHQKLSMKQQVITSLIVDVDELYEWTEEIRGRGLAAQFTRRELQQIKTQLNDKNIIYESLDHTYWALAQDAESRGFAVCDKLKSRMNSIESRLKSLESQFSTEDFINSLNAPAEPLVKTVGHASSASTTDRGTTVTASVTNVIQNVVKLEESVRDDGTKTSADFSSPTLILASLDKSILQIRDWLTLMDHMSRQQTAVVGDDEDIRRMMEKQKSVLRELEGKKPQLDELVASADTLKNDGSRAQLHQQVSKLREHWDETNSSVLGRKTQLDAMLNDTHKFDTKRIEIETWLSRMEARIDRMGPIGHNDMVDQQMREQKSLQSEIHQYRYQIELFTQMTQRLITIYQNDDTRRIKKSVDNINLRFNNLNTSIMSRGKNLQSSGSVSSYSKQEFTRTLDMFLAWVATRQTTIRLIEYDMEQPPSGAAGRKDTPTPAHYNRTPQKRYKDLQSEIENQKDVLASLNATGQKLLGTLENKDDAVLLHRRLEEMNHRWNALKHKSIAIRNRLEGTAESWNSLLLSLRELIEWVIRKDTELTAMSSPIGDLNTLAKYEEDMAIFRRFVDDKQPIIESNLKSGRQLIASEPPLSDTSDSEVAREMNGDARYRGEENARDLTRAVRREVTKLSDKWAALRKRVNEAVDQATMAYKKLGVLLKTVAEVGCRLEDSEKTVATWGILPQDPNLSEQHIHNIRKFRDDLPDLQRGIDDVNDQAARFSAHNVPLNPVNSDALHDLNNRWKTLESTANDRWRQIAGRSREVTPLTPAQLASSVTAPWERATATNKVPYYINHAQETTHWDHPDMITLLDSMSEFNHIKFSAYRTAAKLRALQKKLSLDVAKLQMVADVFDEHGLRGQNDRLIDINDMIVVLSTLYARIVADFPDVKASVVTDLCLNWLLNVYDSQRTGQMRVLSFRVGLICLCRGHLEEKYRYMFRLIADPNRQVDQRKLGLLLHDCVQIPRQLGEVAAFGGSNIEPSVRSCFVKAGQEKDTIEAVHFLSWVQQEPQSLVWLAVLHRVAASESVQHQVKCNICKTYPIIGLRYRCLKCLSFDMCQRCFFDGKSGKSHKITHPMHEYCTATTAGDEMKDFTKALKNKFKSKRSLQKHTKKGYLPVQTVLEGDALESPSPSPSHVSTHDMHSRLELFASRLAEVERTHTNSTPESEDEHGLIAQYCQSLSSCDGTFPVPKSPLQIMASVDADQKDELEQMIRDLEDENRALQDEYDRLKAQQPLEDLDDSILLRSETEMLAEAKLLREHKGRLEARMGILEDHNRQLEAQLHRLRQLLTEQHTGKSGTLQTKSVTASQLAMDSPAKINGHSTQGELQKAVGSLVASMNPGTENDLPSCSSEEPDYDNTVSHQPEK